METTVWNGKPAPAFECVEDRIKRTIRTLNSNYGHGDVTDFHFQRGWDGVVVGGVAIRRVYRGQHRGTDSGLPTAFHFTIRRGSVHALGHQRAIPESNA